MSTVHSLTTAPVNVYSKTYWTGFISAINEEAAYELGLHDKINPEALPTDEGWSASRFTPNILRHTDVYVDRSTNIDFSSRTVHEHHHHYKPTSSSRSRKKNKKLKRKKKKKAAFRNINGSDQLLAPSEPF